MHMGERIRQRRKQLKLTAAQLAKLVRCSRSYISKIENGQRQPSITMLLGLCQALACATIDILSEDPNDKPATPERN